MANIKVTPEELISAAGEFSGIDSSVVNLTNEMNNLVNQMSSFWEGEGFNAFKAQFSQLNDDMDLMHQKIREHSTDLEEMAKEYQRAENETKDISMGLATDPLA